MTEIRRRETCPDVPEHLDYARKSTTAPQYRAVLVFYDQNELTDLIQNPGTQTRAP